MFALVLLALTQFAGRLDLAAAGPAQPSNAASTETGSAPAIREIPVTVVTDGAFRKLHNWRGLIRGAIEEGTADLADSVGLRFVPAEELRWEPEGETLSMAQLLDDALADVGRRPGLTAVFTGRRPERTGQWSELGYAYLGRPALILSAPRRDEIPFASYLEKELVHYFRHELGHVFGIPHLRGRNVMTDQPSEREEGFSEVALDILRATRNMDFSATSPFAGCELETLRDAYFFLDSRGECEPALMVNLGVAFHRERRPEEARPLFEAAIRRKPDSVAGRLGLAQILMDEGDSVRVRGMADELAGDETVTGSALGALGGLWVRLGEPTRARDMLTEALAVDPTRFATWFNRGLASFRLEDYPPAREDFERALEVEERPEGWFNLGLTCDAMDDGDGVRRAFGRFLELEPEGPRADDARKFLERRR